MSSKVSAVTMTEGPLLGVLLKVSAPIALTQIIYSAYDIVNAVFVGRLGADALAAVTASGPMYFVLISLGSGLSTAGAILTAQNAGAKRMHALAHVAAQTLIMVTALGAAFTLFGAAFALPYLDFIGVTPAVKALTWDYLAIRFYALIPAFLLMAIQAILNAIGEVKFTMRVMIGSLFLNILLDPLFIFAFGWGVSGAAVASTVAQLIALAILAHHLAAGHSAIRLNVGDFRPDWKHFSVAANLALPASIEQGTRTFASLILMSMAAQFGTQALAAFGLGIRILHFWFGPMLALSTATSVIVGQNVGAGLSDRVNSAVRTATTTAFVTFTAIGVAHFPMIHPIMTVIAPTEPALAAEAARLSYFYLPFLGMIALRTVFNGAFSGAGSTRLSMGLSLATIWLFQLPSAWLLGLVLPLGVAGMVWSYPIGSGAGAIVAALCFWFLPWKRNLVTTKPNPSSV